MAEKNPSGTTRKRGRPRKNPEPVIDPGIDLKITPEDVKEVSKVNYPKLKKMLENGEVLIVATNDASIPLVLDWNLELMPQDLEEDFNAYLSEKYVQYEIKDLAMDTRIVAILRDGKTINFLNNFLADRRFPLLVPRRVGQESELRSSFVINPGQKVILTLRQADAIRGFEKVKRVWQEGEKERTTPWLGFVKMKTVKSDSDLFIAETSYVTSEDTIASVKPLDEGAQTYSRREAGVIREEE